MLETLQNKEYEEHILHRVGLHCFLIVTPLWHFLIRLLHWNNNYSWSYFCGQYYGETVKFLKEWQFIVVTTSWTWEKFINGRKVSKVGDRVLMILVLRL